VAEETGILVAIDLVTRVVSETQIWSRGTGIARSATTTITRDGTFATAATRENLCLGEDPRRHLGERADPTLVWIGKGRGLPKV